MKKLLVPAVCALVGCVAGVAMPAITAQTFPTPASVQPLQAFCETHNRPSQMDEAVRLHGAEGFHLAGFSGTVLCFERQAQ